LNECRNVFVHHAENNNDCTWHCLNDDDDDDYDDDVDDGC